MKRIFMVIMVIGLAASAYSQTTANKPTTQPANPDLMLKQLLSPSRPQKVLQPIDYPPDIDLSSRTATAPKAVPQNLIREGTYIVNRSGRLTKLPDGSFYEFTFESDGTIMKDPPMLVLPNSKLTGMEEAIRTTSRDLKFMITGQVQEYNSRNYILLEKSVVVQDAGSLKPTKQQKQQDNGQISN